MANGAAEYAVGDAERQMVRKGGRPRKYRNLKVRIQRCGLHAFRHFSASMMDRLNTPLKLREQRLGHSDAAMTLGVYSHVAKEDDLRVAAQLGEILDPSGPFQKTKGAAVSQQPLVK